jgi:hypothetical protein
MRTGIRDRGLKLGNCCVPVAVQAHLLGFIHERVGERGDSNEYQAEQGFAHGEG